MDVTTSRYKEGLTPEPTTKLFVPVSRILNEVLPKQASHLQIAGSLDYPFLSVDMNEDVILQTAFVRRSYHDQQNELDSDFIIDQIYNDSTNESSNDQVMNLVMNGLEVIIPPINTLFDAIGTQKGQKTQNICEPSVSTQFLSFLHQYEANPSPALANIILQLIEQNLDLIYTQYLQKSEKKQKSRFSESISNYVKKESIIWNIDPVINDTNNRVILDTDRDIKYESESREDGQTQFLPWKLPEQIIDFANKLLIDSEMISLPPDVFHVALSKIIPEQPDLTTCRISNWKKELKDSMMAFYWQKCVFNHR